MLVVIRRLGSVFGVQKKKEEYPPPPPGGCTTVKFSLGSYSVGDSHKYVTTVQIMIRKVDMTV